MDPNENLDEQRRIVEKIFNGTNDDQDLDRLAELVQSLDQWLSNGGFKPNDWNKRKYR